MTGLKFLYEELGFKNVSTYIQSGNVILKAMTRTPHSALNKRYRRNLLFMSRLLPVMQMK
jgi:uncharacterized protein (DUF1697 family)